MNEEGGRPGRLLLLVRHTTYRAGAFLDAARSLGVPVTVGTDRPQALAPLHPEGHLTLDFGAIAPSVATVHAFAAQQPIAAVLAADDDGIVLAAQVARALGLPHAAPMAVTTARNKALTRERLAAQGLPTPRFRTLSLGADPAAAARSIAFPCVLKPLDLSASRGVIRANDSAEFVAAFRRVARMLAPLHGDAPGPAVLVEDYLPGAEVAFEGLLERGALREVALFDKPDPLEGPFFEETIYVTPSRLDAARHRAIRDAVAQACAALGLDQGPVHAEVRLDDRAAWIVEIAPRSIGGLCSRALRSATGASLEELILRHALGLDTGGWTREPRAAGVLMIPIPRRGVLREVRGIEAARTVEGVESVHITIPLGQEIVPLPEGDRYLGFVFARADTPVRVEASLRAAHARLEFGVEPAAGVASAARGEET